MFVSGALSPRDARLVGSLPNSPNSSYSDADSSGVRPGSSFSEDDSTAVRHSSSTSDIDTSLADHNRPVFDEEKTSGGETHAGKKYIVFFKQFYFV